MLAAIVIYSNSERAVFHIEVARVLFLMQGFLACAGSAAELHLNAIVLHTADVDDAALHEEVLLAVDAVLHSLRDVDGAVLHLHIFLAVDGVLTVAHDIQCAPSFELSMALGMEASVVVFIHTISQGIGGLFLHTDVDALAVLDVDGRAFGIGQRHASQGHSAFVATIEIELAVARRS